MHILDISGYDTFFWRKTRNFAKNFIRWSKEIQNTDYSIEFVITYTAVYSTQVFRLQFIKSRSVIIVTLHFSNYRYLWCDKSIEHSVTMLPRVACFTFCMLLGVKRRRKQQMSPVNVKWLIPETTLLLMLNWCWECCGWVTRRVCSTDDWQCIITSPSRPHPARRHPAELKPPGQKPPLCALKADR